jgi:phage repressor protein C with HTH and peptisase S24 domain
VESGKKKPSIEMFVGIAARYSDVNPDYLLAGREPMFASRSEQLRIAEAAAKYDASLVMGPHLGIEAGAGAGRYLVGEEAGEFAFREDWLRRKGINPKNAGLATVRGDSMKETLHDGDLMLVDRGDREIRSGRCYVLRQGDEIIVKYLSRLPNGRIQATSENAGAFPPFLIELGVNIEIIGRVRADTHEWD